MSDPSLSPDNAHSAGGSGGAGGRVHRTGGGVARLPIVGAIVMALVAGGLADRAGGNGRPAASAASPAPAVSAAAPAAALSSSWFCAGATDQPGGAAAGQVVIANSGLTVLSGVVTLVPSSGPHVRLPVTVNPDDRTVLAEAVPAGSPWIGAIVDLQGGAASVEQEVTSSLGQSASPCATTGSSNWYFPTGATLVNASTVISLLNPYPTNAIVDLSFVTDQGIESPSDFQGVVVPAGGLTTVDLGTHLRRRQAIATSVAVRTGRVVAWKTDVVTPPAPGSVLLGSPQAATGTSAAPVDPAAPVAGVTVTLGAPSLGTTWVWPDGLAGDGVDERYVIYNPGPGTAVVRLSLNLDQGSAEPFTLNVGPEQVTTITSSQQARIPSGVAHSAVLESTNGVPVAAERTVAAGAPSNRRGLGELIGGRQPAPRWLLAAGSASLTEDEWVVVFNPGSTPVRVTLYALTGGTRAAVPGVAGVSLGAGQRLAVRVADHLGQVSAPFVVSASGPVYAERDLYGSGRSPGVGLSFGVPLTP